MARRYVDRVIEVHFNDHVEDSDHPLKCIVWGKCLACTDDFLTVVCWDTADPSDKDRKDNQKTFTLIRSAIQKIRTLK